MKRFKKMAALLVAMAMVIGMMSTMAVSAAQDTSVTVSGLDKGDQVQFYQILKWTEAGWTLADGFTGLVNDTGAFATQLTNPTAAERLEEVIGMITDGLTMEEGNAISKLASGATAKATVNVADSSASYTIPEGTANLGLYMAVIGAIDPEVTYLPVFVSADYNTENSTEAIDASKANHIPASGGAIAKKSRNHVEKTTEDITSSIATAIDSKIGMEVEFYVDTVIPVYFDCYTPSYKIDDSITTGIELIPSTIKVELDGEDKTGDSTILTVTPHGTDSYTVEFEDDYLLSNKAPVKVHISYKGTVTNEATFNVNEDSNDVTVTYSNGPSGTPAALRDATNHYTFSIGADAFGLEGKEGSTYELIKVSADKDGKPLYSATNIQTWKDPISRHPLESAEFGLYTDAACTVPYSNSKYPGGAKVLSASDGKISFYGLEAGTYYLKEEKAPDGYIKSTTPVMITIEAKYKEVTVPPKSENGVHYAGYTVDVLDSYSVKINNSAIYNGTSYTYSSDAVVNTYHFLEESAHITKLDPVLTSVSDGDIINTPGVELPSTGGMGTKIFYIVGAILVLGAGILLVSRRRMSAQ